MATLIQYFIMSRGQTRIVQQKRHCRVFGADRNLVLKIRLLVLAPCEKSLHH